MAACARRWRATVLCLLLWSAVHADPPRGGRGGGRSRGNKATAGVDKILSELQTVLDTRNTNVAKMDGCGIDQVGSECERATADDDDAEDDDGGRRRARRPDEKRLRAALVPRSEKDALASRGRLVSKPDAHVDVQLFLPPPLPGAPVATGGRALFQQGVSAQGAVKSSIAESADFLPKRDIKSGSVLGRTKKESNDQPALSPRGPCRTRTGMFPHANPRRYYQCKGGRYVVKRCGRGLMFNAELQYCSAAESTRAGASFRRIASTSASIADTTAEKAIRVNAEGVSAVQTLAAKPLEGGKVNSAAGVAVDTRSVMSALRPTQADIAKIVRRAVKDKKRGCFCSATNTRRSWELRDATADQCWAEALRRGARYLLMGTGGCQFWSNVAPLRPASCTAAADTFHVIDIGFFQTDLARLQPDMQYWVSARSPADIVWGTVSNIPDKPMDLRGCGELCYKFGQDFARVDYRGCRCGMAGRTKVTIRQEDLAFLRGRKVPIDPGFTVQLQPGGGLADWECTAAPSHFVRITAARSLQEALIACRERRFTFLTPGKDGFYCGNSTDNLERFSRTQCQMNVTTSRAYSVISIQAIERQIIQVERVIYDYVFWWVSERAPGVFWSSLLAVTELEQCVLACDRRFVAVGPDGCFCGSLREGVTSLHVNEWVVNSTRTIHLPSQGYLMLDKRGFVNVPEGWHCTSEPKHWKVYSTIIFFDQCMQQCKNAKKEYAAFGRLGCLCGDGQDTQLRRLPMARCQDTDSNTDAYSVLSVDVWTGNVDGLKVNQTEYTRTCWVDRKSDGVEWSVQPGANVLEQCINTCNDQQGVSLIMLGVNGCECGFGSVQVDTKKLCNPLVQNARVFLLLHRKTASKGYTPPKFEWIVKANLTKTGQSLDVRVEPWTKLTIRSANQTRSRTIRGGYLVHTTSGDQARANGTNFSSVTDGSNISVTDVNDVEIINQITNNITKDGSINGGQIGSADIASQKLSQKERKQEELKNSELHNIRAGRNDIRINSRRDSNMTVDQENRDQLTIDGYKKQYVKGHRSTQTAASFSRDVDENAVRTTNVTSDIIKKDLLVNQTFGDSMTMDVRMDKQNKKESIAKERSEGSTVILEIHIEGQCYDGPANWTRWTEILPKPESPFKCLCSCLMDKKFYYAIYDQGNCFCSSESGQFGNDMAIVTTDGQCPAGGRSVYDGMKHTQEMGRFCSGRKETSIHQFLQKSSNKGHKVVQFRNTELSDTKVNSSSIQGSHLNSTETEVANAVLRSHGKEGVARSRWESRLVKGPLRHLYGLRLHVYRDQDYVERVNITTREHVRTTHSQRGLPFRGGEGFTLTKRAGSLSSVTNPDRARPGGGLGLLRHDSDARAVATPQGRLTSSRQLTRQPGSLLSSG